MIAQLVSTQHGSPARRPHKCIRPLDRRQARLHVELLESRLCLSVAYHFNAIAQTGAATPDNFSSLGNGVSINDNDYVAFVGESPNSSGQLADNIYAFNPDTRQVNQLMNKVFMYPDQGVDQGVAGTQSFFDEVQINNDNDVLALRRLNASVQIGVPTGTVATAPLTYLETWNADATNPPGLPLTQVGVGVPAGQTAPLWFFSNPATAGVYPSPLPMASPYQTINDYSTINNLGEVNFSADVNGAIVSGVSGNCRISSNISGALIGAGPVGGLVIQPVLADNGFYAITTSSGKIYAEPWNLSGPLQLLAGPASGFTSVSEAGISDDGNVIAFAGANTSTGNGIYVSTFNSATNSYSSPVMVLEGGFSSFSFTEPVCVNRTLASKNDSYTIAFLATPSDGVEGLYTVRVDMSAQPTPTPDAPALVAEIGGTIDGVPGTIDAISLHDSVNDNGHLAFWVSSNAGTDQTIVLAQPVTFDWSMPEDYGLDVNGLDSGLANAVLSNDTAEVNPPGYTLHLDASDTTSDVPIVSWDWTVKATNSSNPPHKANGEIVDVADLAQGQYTVQLTITMDDGTKASVSEDVTVRNILIVAIGDSYSSGEGNPDHPITDFAPAGSASSAYAMMMWAEGGSTAMTIENANAHRSTLAPSSQAAYDIWNDFDHKVSVTFVMLSESGATMDQGIYGWADGCEYATPVPPQLDELDQILAGRKPDIITVSIGGNDLNFAPDLSKLATAGIPGFSSVKTVENDILTEYYSSLSKLLTDYSQLATDLSSQFHPNYVIQTDYPNFTLGTSRLPVAFGYDLAPLGLGYAGLHISQQESEFISGLISETDGTITDEADANDWQCVDVQPPFSTHGYAASDPWITSMTSALHVEGSQSFGHSSGAVHPNGVGQYNIATLCLEPQMLDDINKLLDSPDLGLGNGPAGASSARRSRPATVRRIRKIRSS